jgi:hypothetical protein
MAVDAAAGIRALDSQLNTDTHECAFDGAHAGDVIEDADFDGRARWRCRGGSRRGR